MTTLSQAQLATLKAAVLADPTANGYRLAGDAYSLKAWCNSPGTVSVWRTEAPVSAILDSINLAAYTPNDVADTTVIYTNRALLAQTKQMNLQLMLQGRDRLDASKANVRASLRDAVIQLPTGVAGALVSAGGASGATTLAACVRLATHAEGAFAAAVQTTGATAAQILTFEGAVDDGDASWLVNN
jgi:hypothetical protein